MDRFDRIRSLYHKAMYSFGVYLNRIPCMQRHIFGQIPALFFCPPGLFLRIRLAAEFLTFSIGQRKQIGEEIQLNSLYSVEHGGNGVI